jgi:hypothetical protein
VQTFKKEHFAFYWLCCELKWPLFNGNVGELIVQSVELFRLATSDAPDWLWNFILDGGN